ncbi:MAG TPA: hypothetical protein PKD72_12925, partial [Gemmatales bacterium]|nr:hypothetical protein [Gemmatales bacterium]
NTKVNPPNQLLDLAGLLPHPVQMAHPRKVPAMMQTLTDLLNERKASPVETVHPPVFITIYGIHRLRDLRRNEDDFSMDAGATSPVTQLAELVKEGGPLGIHFLVWVDTATGASRSFDRASLREFTLRVLFQMSANDSSNLIDSPAAGKLGAHRALFFSEELGTLEKLRPFGIPDAETLNWLSQNWVVWKK